MTKRIRVMLLYGGTSSEHEISLRSAASVLKHLDTDRYEILPVGIDKSGQCFHTPAEVLRPLVTEVTQGLPVRTEASQPLPSLVADHGRCALNADVVFPAMHGPLYEDGILQGLLTYTQVAIVGPDVLGAAICMHKDLARRVLIPEGIPFTPYLYALTAYVPDQTAKRHRCFCTPTRSSRICKTQPIRFQRRDP
jgi:D-alanine-D-alanine ligase and related ATP-grasp enzymes